MITFKTGSLIIGALLLWCFLGGCGTLAKPIEEQSVPPTRRYEALIESGPHLFEVDDPLEGANRRIYRFNYYFDEYLLLPVVRGYEFVLPNYLQDRLSSAFDNVGEFGNLTNSLLQVKLKSAGITVGRFLVNSTVGVAGLWDPASSLGLKRQTRNFGQTLGRYRVGRGPYLVVPLLGPSNLRDTSGVLVDTAAASFVGPQSIWSSDTIATVAYSGTTVLDKRHRVSFRYRQTGSPFEYELLRMLNSMMTESRMME